VIAASIRDVGELCEFREVTDMEKIKGVPLSQSMPALSSSLVTSTPDRVIHSMIAPRPHPDVISIPNFLSQTKDVPEEPDCGAIDAEPLNLPASESDQIRVVLVDEFGRDTCVVNEVCQLLEDMPRLWSAYHAFEAATGRFPNIDRAALRLTVLAVLMGQRRCANRMTAAGLNSACAEDYRNSY